MAANKRTKTGREEALARVADLDRMGYGQVAMARMLGVSQPQVCYDLKAVRSRYRETQLAKVEEAVNEKLAQLRDVRCEAWEAWERSKEEGKLPDSGFLAIVLKALQAERDLLGLDAPKEVNAASTPLTPPINWDMLCGGVPSYPSDCSMKGATAVDGDSPASEPPMNRGERRPSCNGNGDGHG